MLSRPALVCICLALIMGCAKGTSVLEDRIRVGDRAPNFVLSGIAGGEPVRSGKIFQSSNATVIVIWSLTCPSCREALRDVQRAYEKYEKKMVAFLGVNFDIENSQGVRAFLKAEGIEFLTLWDRATRATRSYKALDYTFSLFVVDRTGSVVMAQYDHPPDLGMMLDKKLDEMTSIKTD
jgi:peroxiredoxin